MRLPGQQEVDVDSTESVLHLLLRGLRVPQNVIRGTRRGRQIHSGNQILPPIRMHADLSARLCILVSLARDKTKPT